MSEVDEHRRYLVSILGAARMEYRHAIQQADRPQNWDELVSLAMGYVGTVVPKITRDEFDALRDVTVEEVMMA
jgi:hypothetical protein